ncbi:MAG TPA: PQQ-dependent sugar dehydrogenase [Acidiferrobacterales bacterium]
MSYHPFIAGRPAGALLLAAVLAAAAACDRRNAAEPQPTVFPALSVARAFSGLSFASPVAMLQAPSDGARWFVVEREGRVVVFPNDPAAMPAQVSEFVDITVDVDASGEGGLLGMAFHPNFPVTPHVFLSYTRAGPDAAHPLTSVIARFTSNGGGATLDPATELVILTVDQPATNHNGGHIAFDSAGHLFIGLGDGGGSNDPGNHGQNVNTLLGAMLRIDVIGTPAPGDTYAIPGDNPFAAGGGAREIYAWGLRNPWRWSFDRGNGRLWLGDVGQSAWEEIDIVERGRNYGWKVCEGAHLAGSAFACGNPAFTNPVSEYDHGQGCSVSGGYVYRGSAIPALFGVYLYGDFCSGTIWGVKEQPGGAFITEAAAATGLSIVAFGEAGNGDLYVVDFDGTLHKVIERP